MEVNTHCAGIVHRSIYSQSIEHLRRVSFTLKLLSEPIRQRPIYSQQYIDKHKGERTLPYESDTDCPLVSLYETE